MYKLLHLPIDAKVILGTGEITLYSDNPVHEILDPRWAPKRVQEFRAGPPVSA